MHADAVAAERRRADDHREAAKLWQATFWMRSDFVMIDWRRLLQAIWHRTVHNDGAEAEAAAKLAQVRRETPAIRRAARTVHRLPDQEFAARVTQAFRSREQG